MSQEIRYIDEIGLAYAFGLLKALCNGKLETDLSNVDTEKLVEVIKESGAGGTSIVTTSGTGAAFTATVPGIDALTAGVSFTMIPHTTSTAVTPTLDVNGLGAIKMYRRLSSNVSSVQTGYNVAWLMANKPIEVMYDGMFWIVMGQEKPSTADLSGTLAVEKGGTGATSAEAALTNLGAAAADHAHSEYAPAYTYGTEDLTAGTSPLATGTLYFVYE